MLDPQGFVSECTGENLFLVRKGTVITTPDVSASSATVALAVTVDNDSAARASVAIETDIFELGADDRPRGQAVATVSARALIGACLVSLDQGGTKPHRSRTHSRPDWPARTAATGWVGAML